MPRTFFDGPLNRLGAACLCTALCASVQSIPARSLAHAPQARARPAPGESEPFVLKPKILDVERAARLLATLFPDAHFKSDKKTNSVIGFAGAGRIAKIQAVFDALDTKGANAASAQAFSLKTADPARLVATLHRVFPGARAEAGPNRSVVVTGTPELLTQIGAVVTSVDTPLPPAARAPIVTDTVALGSAHASEVARAISAIGGVRANAAGGSVVLTGSSEAVGRAKTLAAQLDLPAVHTRYTQVYRLKFVDVTSVVALLRRNFAAVTFDVDAALNAFSAGATTAEHQRIADAVAQLDQGPSVVSPNGPPVAQPGMSTAAVTSANGTLIEVLTLRAAAPGIANAPSTTANDIATAVTQILQTAAPDLKMTVPPNNPTQIILAGSAPSITLAKNVIAQLDVAQKLVVLDTEILEVDESSAKNLGLSLGPNPIVSTTYTETTPPVAANGLTPPLLGLHQLARTPISFSAQLNLLIQRGNARILADPRITTISGRTATIRAGENISILTTTGGGNGVAVTTQLQTFQTGVTLDITPVINAGNFITVGLHPVVNSLSGTTNGVPQISTRDTQTTVAMQEDQTLVIGGLIEDTTTRSETRIPFLGDAPIVGKMFRNSTLNSQRNELIITVTPHIINPGQAPPSAPAATVEPPTPQPLPTLPPATTLPVQRPNAKAGPGPARPGVALPAPAATTVVALPTSAANAAPSATPQPTPSAFAQTNVFTYGSPPPNNFAGPSDAVQIFYATFSPTVVKNTTSVSLNVVTSSNAQKVTIGYQGFTTQLSPSGSGRWQTTYNFMTAGLPAGQSQINLTLTATRFDGTSAKVTIPVSISP